MTKIERPEDFGSIAATGNDIIGDAKKVSMVDSVVSFNGKNNIVVFEDGLRLFNSKVVIHGSGNLVYISRSNHNVIINANVFNNSVLYIGKNAYFNGTLNISLSEEKNLLIGNRCLFSFGIWIRTADPHLIYDVDSKVRVNPSKSVLIGDHVWIGQSALILKGSCVGSGSIVGAGAVFSKSTGTNEVWGGNPAVKLKDNVFWSGESVHNFVRADTDKFNTMNKEDGIFTRDDKISQFKYIDALPKGRPDEWLKILNSMD